MRSDVKIWTEQCIPCQKYKTSRKLSPPLYHFPTTSRFETVHIDLVGPLPLDRGFQYILTMLDRATRWPEAVPLKTIDADTICRTFMATWICRFGAPKHLISDQGRQFESGLFRALVEKLGTTHVHTSAYHPQSNGVLERFHRTFKISLKILADNNTRWLDVIPYVLLGWRNTPSTSTNTAPAQALFGSSIRFLAELTDSNETPTNEDIQIARNQFELLDKDLYCKALHNFKEFLPKSLYSAKFLWLKNQTVKGLHPTYSGPYKIIEIFSHNAKILKDGIETLVHISNTKPAFTVEDTKTDSKTLENTKEDSTKNLTELLNLSLIHI